MPSKSPRRLIALLARSEPLRGTGLACVFEVFFGLPFVVSRSTFHLFVQGCAHCFVLCFRVLIPLFLSRFCFQVLLFVILICFW